MQAALVVVLLRHGFRRNFPLFFAYNIYSVGASIVRISTMHHEVANFWVYFATDLIYLAFALLVLQSIFQKIWEFKPAPRLLVVPIWLMVIGGLAAWWGMLHPIARGKLAGDLRAKPVGHAPFECCRGRHDAVFQKRDRQLTSPRSARGGRCNEPEVCERGGAWRTPKFLALLATTVRLRRLCGADVLTNAIREG